MLVASPHVAVEDDNEDPDVAEEAAFATTLHRALRAADAARAESSTQPPSGAASAVDSSVNRGANEAAHAAAQRGWGEATILLDSLHKVGASLQKKTANSFSRLFFDKRAVTRVQSLPITLASTGVSAAIVCVGRGAVQTRRAGRFARRAAR